MTFLQELGAAARACPDILRRKLLNDARERLFNAIQALTAEPTKDNMVTLNGAWISAVKTLDATPPLGDGGDSAGSMPVPQERTAA